MQVKVSIPQVNEVKVTTKCDEDGLVSIVQLEARLSPSDVARLLNLQAKSAPIYCEIGSNQAMLDLVINEVDANGEVK